MIAEEDRSEAGTNCEVVTSVVECTAGEGLTFFKSKLVNSNHFEVRDVDELEESLFVANDSHSASVLQWSGSDEFDWAKRVLREVDNLVDCGRGVEFDITVGETTGRQEHLRVCTVELNDVDWLHDWRNSADKFDHDLVLEVDVVDVAFGCSKDSFDVQFVHDQRCDRRPNLDI